MIKKVLFALGASIAAIGINYGLLEKLIIPNPCYYHTHKANYVIRLFYDFPIFNGTHPFPSLFNLLFTLGTGIILGLITEKLFRKSKSERSNLLDN